MTISPAVDRNQAETLREANVKTPKDKRNLYLAREGCIEGLMLLLLIAITGAIMVNSEAFKSLSEHDKKKRQAIDAELKIKRNNPNYFVSMVTGTLLHD